jgi:hypothetical protein
LYAVTGTVVFQGESRGQASGDRALVRFRSLQRGVAVPDQFDVSLEDSDLLGEVELTTNLIIAASETDDHLSDAEIDEILGVTPHGF